MRLEQGIDLKGTCFYCWNYYLEYSPHWFQDLCQLYQRHLLVGTIHVNQNSRICLGLLRKGACKLWLQCDSLQGNQVRLYIASTKYNKNIANRPKKEVSKALASTPSLVSRLTFVVVDLEDKDKKEIKEYGDVSIVNIAKANKA